MEYIAILLLTSDNISVLQHLYRKDFSFRIRMAYIRVGGLICGEMLWEVNIIMCVQYVIVDATS